MATAAEMWGYLGLAQVNIHHTAPNSTERSSYFTRFFLQGKAEMLCAGCSRLVRRRGSGHNPPDSKDFSLVKLGSEQKAIDSFKLQYPGIGKR